MSDVTLRRIDAAEHPAWLHAMYDTFGEDFNEADLPVERGIYEPERTLGGFDGDVVVATAAIASRELTLPGGPRPMAGITNVTVAPTHRRRGLLTEIVRRQLTELHDQQLEAASVLWASEGSIYGRFGYGVAGQRAITRGLAADLRLRPGTDTGSGRVRVVDAAAARPVLVELYERLRPGEVGWVSRSPAWWDYVLYDAEHARGGASRLRYALHTEDDGSGTGYAAYRIKQDWDERAGNQAEVGIKELATVTPAAKAALWVFLTGLDLVPVLARRIAPVDEPLQQQLLDPRALHVQVRDSLWVRLADVGRALAERSYTRNVDVVFEVSDDFCPWNAGRWRLVGGADGASCERTGAAADLALSSTELGAAYLGGTGLALLAAAGRVEELRPGALLAAHWAFLGVRQPFCPEMF